MCMLSYLPPGVAADEDGLFNGGLYNPDGYGWAIVDGDEIIVGKSLDLCEALDGFIKARIDHLSGPALFHSRLSTHGSVSVANVHPFEVGGSRKTVVAHNGILPREAHPTDNDDRSDTRKFADEILPRRFRRLDRPKVQRALSQWLGKYNKLVILTTNPRYRRSAYLINGEQGHWDKTTGIWHSNSDYLDMPRWQQSAFYEQSVWTGQQADWRDDSTDYKFDTCPICQYGEVSPLTGYCYECGTCRDCLEWEKDCQCWMRDETNKYPARRY